MMSLNRLFHSSATYKYNTLRSYLSERILRFTFNNQLLESKPFLIRPNKPSSDIY